MPIVRGATGCMNVRSILIRATGGDEFVVDEQLQLDPRSRIVFIQDRKSTRLNSSHVEISYAVFCLKKKKHVRLIICESQRRYAVLVRQRFSLDIPLMPNGSRKECPRFRKTTPRPPPKLGDLCRPRG